MKTPLRTLCLIFCLCLSVCLISSCGKKKASVSDTTKPEGQTIGSGGPADTAVEEDSLTVDDLLDNAGKGDFSMTGNQDDAYKKTYGRSSKPLLPIYFAFDESTISADQADRLQQNARYLLDHPEIRVVVEGNCDERGTSEYNLALGERRALSAKNYLIQLGIEESRLTTRSYGEERPLYATSGEASWAENRRDDFVIE
jgi:peptidoglycan-associated lipoprotein